MTCRDCGTQNHPGSVYCKKCGADLYRRPEPNTGRKSLLQLLLHALR